MIDRVLGDLKLAVGVFMNGDEKNARLLLDEKVQIPAIWQLKYMTGRTICAG